MGAGLLYAAVALVVAMLALLFVGFGLLQKRDFVRRRILVERFIRQVLLEEGAGGSNGAPSPAAAGDRSVPADGDESRPEPRVPFGVTVYQLRRSTSTITDAEVLRLLEANQLQQDRDFAPAWGLVPARILIASADQPIPPCAVGCQLRDARPDDDPDALAYHTVEDGRSTIHVLVDRILAQPGATLDDVSCALGHEILEEREDFGADESSDRDDGSEEPFEVVDRVQDTRYPKTLSDGTKLAVTNFLLPAAFVPGSEGPWDFLGLLKERGGQTPGGYHLERQPGGQWNVAGDARACLRFSRRCIDCKGIDVATVRKAAEASAARSSTT